MGHICTMCCCRGLLHVDGCCVCCLPLEPYLQCTQHFLVIHLALLAMSSTAACGTCRGLVLYRGWYTAAVIIMQV